MAGSARLWRSWPASCLAWSDVRGFENVPSTARPFSFAISATLFMIRRGHAETIASIGL
ncbi:hypothetical protein D3C85_1439520 [compost metagenome]